MLAIYGEINRRPSVRDRISLGALVLLVTGVLGAYQLNSQRGLSLALWAVGGSVFALMLIPPVGRILYIGWMGLGLTLGIVTSPVILLVVYLVCFTPLALVFRLMRRDAMKRSFGEDQPSFWEDYPETQDSSDYLRQF